MEILGPRVVAPAAGNTQKVGPYMRLSMYDGVGYVDGRPAMRISYHRTGP